MGEATKMSLAAIDSMYFIPVSFKYSGYNFYVKFQYSLLTSV